MVMSPTPMKSSKTGRKKKEYSCNNLYRLGSIKSGAIAENVFPNFIYVVQELCWLTVVLPLGLLQFN